MRIPLISRWRQRRAGSPPPAPRISKKADCWENDADAAPKLVTFPSPALSPASPVEPVRGGLALQNLPVELLLRIVLLLDVADIQALAQVRLISLLAINMLISD